MYACKNSYGDSGKKGVPESTQGFNPILFRTCSGEIHHQKINPILYDSEYTKKTLTFL